MYPPVLRIPNVNANPSPNPQATVQRLADGLVACCVSLCVGCVLCVGCYAWVCVGAYAEYSSWTLSLLLRIALQHIALQ